MPRVTDLHSVSMHAFGNIYFFNYLNGRKRENLLCAHVFPKHLQQLQWGQPEARSSTWVSRVGGRGSNTRITSFCLQGNVAAGTYTGTQVGVGAQSSSLTCQQQDPEFLTK